MLRFMKGTTLAVGLCALLVGGAVKAKETIVIGDVSWDASHVISHVLKTVIEEKLDAQVKIIPADQAAIFAAMDKGDGSIDVHPDLWIPVQADRWAKYIAPGSKESVLVNDHPYRGTGGLYVPGFVQDKYNIRRVEQLSDPAIAKIFDRDGSGKGSYWPGAPGWNSVNEHMIRAKSYGFDKLFKSFVVSDPVMRAELAKVFATKSKPFVFMFWEPEGLFEKYDLRKLEEAPFDGYAMESKKDDPQYRPDGCFKMYLVSETPDWLEKSRIVCGAPDSTVYVAYSKSLIVRAPKVARFLKQVQFDLPSINNWILEFSDSKNPEKIAKSWVSKNKNIVETWVSER